MQIIKFQSATLIIPFVRSTRDKLIYVIDTEYIETYITNSGKIVWGVQASMSTDLIPSLSLSILI